MKNHSNYLAGETGLVAIHNTDAPAPETWQDLASGEYEVELDEDTLVDHELTDSDRNPLTVNVQPGRVRPAIFQIGEGAGGV